jgi:hypothetical protein
VSEVEKAVVNKKSQGTNNQPNDTNSKQKRKKKKVASVPCV